MILRFFKSYQPTLLIIIPLIGLLFWFKSFVNPSQVTFPNAPPMPLYQLVLTLVGNNRFLQVLLSFILSLSFCYLLVNLNTKFIFISERTYLPALLGLLIVSSFSPAQVLNPVICGGVILLFAIAKLLESNVNERMSYSLLDASFLVSLSSLFYPFLLVYIFVIWLSLIFLRPMYWREWVFSIIGLLAPYALLFIYYYIFTKYSLAFCARLLINPFNHQPLFGKVSMWYFLIWGYLVVLVLLASNHMLKAYSRKKILARKSYLIFLWFFVITGMAYFIIPATSLELIIIITIPVSYILSDYFMAIKSRFWGETLFLILFVLAILVRLYAS